MCPSSKYVRPPPFCLVFRHSLRARGFFDARGVGVPRLPTRGIPAGSCPLPRQPWAFVRRTSACSIRVMKKPLPGEENRFSQEPRLFHHVPVAWTGAPGGPCRDRAMGSANFLDRSQNGWGASHRWTGSRILPRAVEDGSPLSLWRSRVVKAQSKSAC